LLAAPGTETTSPHATPELTRALADYEHALSRLSSPYVERREAALPNAVAQLERAIAAVPNGAPFAPVSEPLADVQRLQLRMIGAPPDVSRASAALALVSASRALESLASGPYAGQPAVRARVDRFTASAQRALTGESLRQGALIVALQDADAALRAIYAVALAESP
jgi:hypothetical protein